MTLQLPVEEIARPISCKAKECAGFFDHENDHWMKTLTTVKPLPQRKNYTIGVDIGGTKIAFALIDDTGSVIENKRILTQLTSGPEMILVEIGKQINLLIKEYGANISGIGLATPGYVDTRTGIVKNAVNLNWKDVKVVDILKNSITASIPIYLQRDTAAETLGEHYFGAGKDCQDFVFLGIGTGFGAGAMTSGHLLTGVNNMALEIGHLSVDQHGPVCACGNMGCIETVLSGKGLVNRARDLYSSSSNLEYSQMLDSITAEWILERAKEHDPIAEELLQHMSKSLGFVCAMLKTILDPERFIIGGGLGKAIFHFLRLEVEKEMDSRVLKVDNRQVQFFQSTLKTSAMGAAAMVWYFNGLLPKSIHKNSS
jgi:glucokinase